MGRLFYLFVCYGGQELCRAMDGRGSDCIKEGLRNGRRKVSIKGRMKVWLFFGMQFLLVFIPLKLLS
jgi:hypothetical protein